MSRDDFKLYDVRTLERNIRKGLITRKDADKFLKALPDATPNAAWTRIDEVGDDDEDDLDGPAGASA